MAVVVDAERKLNGHVPHDVFTPVLTNQSSDDLKKKESNSILVCPDVEIPSDETRQSYCQIILSWRFGMAVMLLLSIVINYLPHITLPMALICDQRSRPLPRPLSSNMSISEEPSSLRNFSAENMTSFNISDHVTSRTHETIDEGAGGEFQWDAETQGLVLSSLFFTGMVGPLLSDVVRRYLGNKWTLAMFMMTSALLTFVSPVAARTSAYHLMAVRILQGITSNANQPILGDTLAWWSPHSEILTLSTFVNAGHGLSCVFAFAVSGYLCAIPLDNGWPFVFYVLGAVSVLWIISWVLLTSRKPEDHPFISEKEKTYITTHRKGLTAKIEGQKKEKTPYKKIFTSVPVYAYLYASSSAVWIMNVNFTFLPIYLNRVLYIPVGTTGLLVAIFTGVLTVASFCWSAVGNSLVSRMGFTINKSRKLCLFVGFTFSGALLAWLSFLDESSKGMAIGVLCTTMFFHSVSPSVIPVVPLDMAPRYSGFLTAFRYSLGRLLAISGPLIISEMTPTNSPGEWQHVWILLGCLHLVANLVFVCFGEASLQPWATPPAGLPSGMAPLMPSGTQERPPIVKSPSQLRQHDNKTSDPV